MIKLFWNELCTLNSISFEKWGRNMKWLFVCGIIFSSTYALSQTQEQRDQLTSSERLPEIATPLRLDPNDFGSTRVIEINKQACDQASALRRQIGFPMPEEALQRVRALDAACGVMTTIDGEGDVIGFEFTNRSKNAINPRTAPNGSQRVFQFNFEERSKQDINLEVTDNSGLSGRLSHDLLETQIMFIPRDVLPSVRSVMTGKNCDTAAHLVTLPNEEILLFDALTSAIIGGVLEESPMDMEQSRHKRNFAGLEYQGAGIMIRADRRAGTPEHTYSVAFNQNERINEATLTYQGRTCHVPKSMIWENTNNPDTTAYFKYATDQEFLDQVVNPRCGWGNLTVEDLR
tara:strand:- start:612 stop:1649 length:1038 start_codon:yes stop_codon:yes gene_type:complete